MLCSTALPENSGSASEHRDAHSRTRRPDCPENSASVLLCSSALTDSPPGFPASNLTSNAKERHGKDQAFPHARLQQQAALGHRGPLVPCTGIFLGPSKSGKTVTWISLILERGVFKSKRTETSGTRRRCATSSSVGNCVARPGGPQQLLVLQPHAVVQPHSVRLHFRHGHKDGLGYLSAGPNEAQPRPHPHALRAVLCLVIPIKVITIEIYVDDFQL